MELFTGFEIRPSRAFCATLPGSGSFSHIFMGASHGSPLGGRFRRSLAGLRCHGISATPRGHRFLPDPSRGVHCVPGQVAILSGVQEALDLVVRLLVNPGDRVCMEDPGYPGAATAFESVGAKISAVPLDGEGITLREKAISKERD